MSSNVDAIYAEYPFLNSIKARVKVSQASVKRWNENFLCSTPESSEYKDAGGEKIYFLDERGAVVTRVGTLADRIFWLLGAPWTDDTVGQALARMKQDSKKVRYAVGVWQGRVTLWKLPNDYANAFDWMNDMIEQARRVLRSV